MANYVSGRLRSYVHVPDDDGKMHVFGPSSEVPRWAAERITNTKAWATPPTFPDAEVIDLGDGGSGAGDAPTVTGEAPTRPPNSGKGAGRPEWAAYATHLGIVFTDDDNRDAIRAKVQARETADGGEV